jgi:hypothetical protein
MLISALQNFLTAPTTNKSSPQFRFFFSLSLIFTVIYGLMALEEAFSANYVIQDDARQHVFWMQRFIDPELFPNDVIADFFQSIAPWGYTIFYKLFAIVGVDPIFLSKILPLGLGVAIAAYFFGISMQILPVPAVGFIATMLFEQNIWKIDNIISATPRAFGRCLLIVFLYYLLRYTSKRLDKTSLGAFYRPALACLVALVLIGQFYPQYGLICAGLIGLQLFRWRKGSLRLSQNSQDYWFCGIGLAVAVLVMLPYALQISDFGPTISADRARLLPEFWDEGRLNFFHDDLWYFYMGSTRSGLFPESLLTPTTLAFGLLLPFLLIFSRRFPLAKHLSANIALLPQMLLTSVGWFVAAHALLFKLHRPSVYTSYTFKIAIALAAGIAIALLLDNILRWARQPSLLRQSLALASVGIFAAATILFPATWGDFPKTNYIVGRYPSLYQFLAEQPKDILVASLSEEANNLPTFAQRSVFVSWEHSFPYQVGYDEIIRPRVMDLIRAQYSRDLDEVRNFINEYGIDFLLVDSVAFTSDYLSNNSWFKQWKTLAQEIEQTLEAEETPALAPLLERCGIVKSEDIFLLPSECIVTHRD